MKHTVQIYLGKDKEEELEILIPYNEMKEAVEKLDWFKENHPGEEHQPVCDFCCKPDKMFAVFPELGHKCMCQKCAKEHKKNVKWYTLDLHPVFDSLISWVLTYDIGWSENDYRMIDEFFSSKGHNEIHIKKFIEQYKKEV